MTRCYAEDSPDGLHWTVANPTSQTAVTATQAVRASIGTARSGKLHRARSRLYRSQILQVNTRWKALAEIYKMHSFAQLLESKIENWGKKDLAKTSPKR